MIYLNVNECLFIAQNIKKSLRNHSFSRIFSIFAPSNVYVVFVFSNNYLKVPIIFVKRISYRMI